jgi:hypothetical protein
MDSHEIPRYAHRPNKDGSYDSICAACFATVATVRDECELAQHERTHVCNPFWPYEGVNPYLASLDRVLRMSDQSVKFALSDLGVTYVISRKRWN